MTEIEAGGFQERADKTAAAAVERVVVAAAERVAAVASVAALRKGVALRSPRGFGTEEVKQQL